MSSDIEKKIVEIEFQNRNFEKGVKQTQQSIQELNKSLEFKGSEKGIQTVEKALQDMNLNDLNNNVKKISKSFSDLGIMGTAALTRISNAAMTMGKNLIKSFTIDPLRSGMQEYETQLNSVQTILANTKSHGTTIEQVNAALDELNHYADLTIYNFTEMTRNIGKFTAAGIDLRTSVDAIQGIANLAAVSGSNSQQASVAMYQLSQALAAGTVRLMDWNSVVNAGMGGEVFQNALRKTSEELGTGAEAAIKAQGSFRESLRTGWLTSEVLTETLKKFTTTGANEWVAEYTGLTKEAVEETLKAAEAEYGEAEAIEEASKQLAEKSGKNQQEIKDVLEMAKTAEDAATKVKTFSQLMSTLKEAVQSGWSETWRTVIGDFEEAKEMFTDIKDAIEPVLLRSSELRNNMLKVWKSLGGRTKLLEGLANISNSILDIWNSIYQAFYDVFGIVGKELYEMTNNFAELTKELVVNKKTMEDIKRVVRGLASILEIAVSIVSAAANMIFQVFVYLKPLLAEVLHLLAILGDGITILGYILKQTQLFNRLGMAVARTLLLIGQIVDGLLRILAAGALITFRMIFLLIQTIATLYSEVDRRFGGIGGLIIKTIGILANQFPEFGDMLRDLEPAIEEFASNIGKFVGSLTSAFGGALDIIDGFATAFKQGIMAFFDELSAMDSLSLDGLVNSFTSFGKSFTKSLEIAGVDITALKDAFKTFGTIVVKVFDIVLAVAKPVLETIIDMVNRLFSLLTDKSVIAIALLALLVNGIFKMIDNLTGTFADLTKSLTDNINKVGTSISTYFDAMAAEKKSEAFKNLAISIALMAGSLILLTFVDQDKLKSSAIILGLFAVGIVLFTTAIAELASWLASKGGFTIASMSGFASTMLGMSVSILLIIKAVSLMQEEMNKTRAYGDVSFVGALWSLIGAFTALTVLATIMSTLTSKWSPASFTATISFAVQMLVVVAVVKQLAEPGLQLGKALLGLVAIGGFLLAFTAISGIIKNCNLTSGGSWKEVLATALALRTVLSTLLKINDIPMEVLTRALVKSLGVIFAFEVVMSAANKVGGNDASKTIRDTALAFLGLVVAMKIISKMDYSEILHGTIGVMAMLLPLTGLMLISKIGSNKIEAATKTILSMSGAIAVMALCAALLSLIDPAGLARGTVAISIMTAVMGGVIFLTKYMNRAKAGVRTMKTMALIIGVLAISAAVMAHLDFANLIVAFSGIAVVLGMMSLVFLTAKGFSSGKASFAMLAMAVPILAIAGALALLGACDVDTSIETMAGFAIIIASVAGIAALMSVIPINGIVVGCLSLILIAATLLLVFEMFSLAFDLGAKNGIVKGAQILGDSLGALIGGIIGGIGMGTAAMLPVLGSFMTMFMDNIQGFLDGARNMDGIDFGALFALAGLVATLSIAAVLSITIPILSAALASLGMGLEKFVDVAEDVTPAKLDSIAKIFEGLGGLAFGMLGFSAGNLKSFGDGLPDLATNIVKFTNALLGEDGESALDVDRAEEGAKIFAAFAKVAATVPRSGGLIGLILGDVDLGGFVGAMGQAGPAIKKFHDDVAGLQYETVKDGLKILEETIRVASDIPNSGGWIGAIVGENNLDAFAIMMHAAAPQIAAAVGYLKGVKYSDAEEGLKVLKATIDTAQSIPNSGASVVSAFVGDNSLEEFAKQMANAGADIKKFLDEMPKQSADADFSVYDQAYEAIAVLGAIISVAAGIDTQTGWEKFWEGDNSLTAIGEDLATFGPKFAEFWSAMSDVSMSGDEMVKKSQALGEFLNGLAKISGVGDITLPEISAVTAQDTIYALADNMVTAASSQTAIDDIKAAGAAIMSYFSDALYPDSTEQAAHNMASSFFNYLQSELENNSSQFTDLGKDILGDIGTAFEGGKMKDTAEKLSQGLIDEVKEYLGIESPSKKFEDIGKYVILGLSKGLEDRDGELKTASDNMASTVENQFRDDLGIHSPSTVFEDIGTYIVDGLKNGLSSGGSMQDILGGVLGDLDFGSMFGDFGEDMKNIFSGTFDEIDFGEFSLESLDDGSFVDGLMTKIQDQMDEQGLTADVEAVFDADALQEQLNGLDGTISTSGTGGIASTTMDSFANTKFEDTQQDSSGGKNSFSFVQNNYSPTALDRIAIYRQTRNQFAAMKEVVNRA